MDWRHLPEITGSIIAVYSQRLIVALWTKPAGGMAAFIAARMSS